MGDPAHWLRGRVAVVTGASRGIGAATAALLVERGANVAVLDRDVNGVEAPLIGVRADVTEPRCRLRMTPAFGHDGLGSRKDRAGPESATGPMGVM